MSCRPVRHKQMQMVDVEHTCPERRVNATVLTVIYTHRLYHIQSYLGMIQSTVYDIVYELLIDWGVQLEVSCLLMLQRLSERSLPARALCWTVEASGLTSTHSLYPPFLSSVLRLSLAHASCNIPWNCEYKLRLHMCVILVACTNYSRWFVFGH